MRSRILWAAAACLFSSYALAGGWPTMNDQIDQTNFVVNQGCSGTLIDLENRYILTASHCIDGQYETVEIEKVNEDGTVTTEKIRRLKPGSVQQMVFDGGLEIRMTSYRTKVIGVDKKRDLALVQILSDIPNTMASRIACESPKRGDTAYVVGNPRGVLYSSVVKGIVASLQRTYETIGVGYDDYGDPAQPLMQISSGMIGGNSGGSVYNEDGWLMGVPVRANTQNEILGFAVPPEPIREFLTSLKLQATFVYCVKAVYGHPV